MKKIIIINNKEDDELIKKWNVSEECQLVYLSSPFDAKKYLEIHSSKILLILINLWFPYEDKFDFIEFCKKDSNYKNIPIIVRANENCVEPQVRALSLGAEDYIVEPYRQEILYFKVQNLIQLKKKVKLFLEY